MGIGAEIRPGEGLARVGLRLAALVIVAGVVGAVTCGCPAIREGVMRVTPGVPDPRAASRAPPRASPPTPGWSLCSATTRAACGPRSRAARTARAAPASRSASCATSPTRGRPPAASAPTEVCGDPLAEAPAHPRGPRPARRPRARRRRGRGARAPGAPEREGRAAGDGRGRNALDGSGWSLEYAREHASVTLPGAGPALDLMAMIPVAGPILASVAGPSAARRCTSPRRCCATA